MRGGKEESKKAGREEGEKERSQLLGQRQTAAAIGQVVCGRKEGWEDGGATREIRSSRERESVETPWESAALIMKVKQQRWW